MVEDFELSKDLRSARLPQNQEFPPIGSDDNQELLRWSHFITEIYKSINLNPDAGLSTKRKVRSLLQIPSKIMQKEKDLPIFETLKSQFDKEFPKSVLRYLFSDEEKYLQGKVNVFKLTMGYQGGLTQSKVAHPVYWLAILYWLKNDMGLAA